MLKKVRVSNVNKLQIIRIGWKQKCRKILPFAMVGMWKAILITPTKSSSGIKDRRIDLILMASPLPAWIS